MPKKIVDAKSDENGVTTEVKLDGNKTFTPIKTAIGMADRGEIDGAHVVRRKKGYPYLRTNPNGRERDNIDYLSGDKS